MTANDTTPEPGSPEWLLAKTPAPVTVVQKSGDVAWKLATFVFGAATVVLAILLAGQLASPRVTPDTADPAQQSTDTSTTAPTIEPPAISDVSTQVGALGLGIMQNYNTAAGWPADVTLDGGTASTAEGIVLGEVPESWKLTYERAADGSGFTLTLEDENGETAVFGPAAVAP